MLLNKIYETEALQPFLSKTCCENEVCITFEEDLLQENYVVIKVDDYYNSQGLGKETPPSPDCLIIRRCEKSGYGLTIAELKNISTASHFNVANLKAKFKTCFENFIQNRFAELLFIEYNNIELYFVSHIELYNKRDTRDLGLRLETLIDTRFKYNRKSYMIKLRMPHPTIKKCY
jgi:hypothetical protein